MATMPTAEPYAPKKRRNWWVWVSAVLGVVAIGLLVWGLNTRSDLESSEDDVADVQSQVEQGKQTGSSFAAAAAAIA
jgi:drug/metabolite transporter (DMT)-like permease